MQKSAQMEEEQLLNQREKSRSEQSSEINVNLTDISPKDFSENGEVQEILAQHISQVESQYAQIFEEKVQEIQSQYQQREGELLKKVKILEKKQLGESLCSVCLGKVSDNKQMQFRIKEIEKQLKAKFEQQALEEREKLH